MSDTIPLIQLPQVTDLAACTGIVENFGEDRMSNQECHATAQWILESVGGTAEAERTGWSAFRTRLQSDSRGVYRVNIKVPSGYGHIPVWGHSFAVVKVGTEIVIYQSFQGVYAFSAWLNRTAGPHATRYAAASGEALASERVQEFFLGIEGMLAHFVSGKAPSALWACLCGTPDYDEHADEFYDAAVTLFGASAARKGTYRSGLAGAISRGAVEVTWTRAPIPQH
jgi:hypothetical protein